MGHAATADAPRDDTFLALQGHAATFDPTSSDPAGVRITSVSAPAHGTVSRNLDGTYTYRPDARFRGDDHFAYRTTDGTATVRVLVR